MASSNADQNLLNTMWALDRSMLQAHREGGDANTAKSESTAKTLLEYPELPLLIRARALVILGCSNEPGFLDHAKEAVRIAQLAIDTSSNVTERARTLLKSCEHVLKEAQEAYDEEEEEEEEEEDTASVEENGEDEADVMVVWQNGEPVVVKDDRVDKSMTETAVGETMDIDDKIDTNPRRSATIPKGKKIKSRRMNSGYADGEERVQHYDRAVNDYVEAGTAIDPLLVDEEEEDEMLLGYVGEPGEGAGTA